ncbi:FtsH protease activity modulator HflK [Altererythrobacter sp. Root672]|uniref:FtsH protease activity modulator HflK n=1 Tax=Altererythrobacter sp. Root672 TaxID=1736584 RepID=UPI0019102FD6|nr:FtsH protease activity modulator HflK [Altererythrobacter sp. Root672]
MEKLGGFIDRIALAMAGKRSPWGKPQGDKDNPGDGSGSDDGSTPPSSEESPKGPRNPWLPGGGSEDRPRRGANIEDLFKQRGPEGPRRSKGPGGPGFRIPERPGGGSWIPIIIGGLALLWVGVTSVHQVAPREEGVVTTFGRYSRTLSPGLNFTLPWPIQQVSIENVSEIRSVRIPSGPEEKLILTGDQNLVDLSYLIRWNIKDLSKFRFQLAEPEETLREVGEAAMRASVAEHTLDKVLSGQGRGDIEQSVRLRMQQILDSYNSGIAVQGIEIQKTDPPEAVVEAFKDVSAAQQDANTAMNQARTYEQQLLAKAQGDAAAFNKIYEEYKLAPEVTRRRLYYETMESVLGKTDKTIVESNSVTPYLPLPEVRRRAAPQAETTPPAGR